jgi:hypothetical protein
MMLRIRATERPCAEATTFDAATFAYAREIV